MIRLLLTSYHKTRYHVLLYRSTADTVPYNLQVFVEASDTVGEPRYLLDRMNKEFSTAPAIVLVSEVGVEAWGPGSERHDGSRGRRSVCGSEEERKRVYACLEKLMLI